MGDINRNLMSPNDGGSNTFFNMIYWYAFEPMHILPSRFTDKFANMLTIISQQCTPGILIGDISDHFPIFTSIDFSCQRNLPENAVTQCRQFTGLNLSLFESSVSNETLCTMQIT